MHNVILKRVNKRKTITDLIRNVLDIKTHTRRNRPGDDPGDPSSTPRISTQNQVGDNLTELCSKQALIL